MLAQEPDAAAARYGGSRPTKPPAFATATASARTPAAARPLRRCAVWWNDTVATRPRPRLIVDGPAGTRLLRVYSPRAANHGRRPAVDCWRLSARFSLTELNAMTMRIEPRFANATPHLPTVILPAVPARTARNATFDECSRETRHERAASRWQRYAAKKRCPQPR